MWLRRTEGIRIKRMPVLRRMMPFLMPRRNEAAVYFKQVIDVTHTLEFLETVNKGRRKEDAITLFHVVLCSASRALYERPDLNRFIVGQRLYQRRTVDISFAVKKQMKDKAAMTAVKVTFAPDDTLDTVVRRVNERIHTGRGKKSTAAEAEMQVVTRLPRFVLRNVMRAQRALDYFNMLPDSMIRNDPLYASLFLANMGSIGLEAVYHHLYEYGTAPLFGAIGRLEKLPLVDDGGKLHIRDTITAKFTYDERVADGFYAARSLDNFKDYIQHPEPLMQTPRIDPAEYAV